MVRANLARGAKPLVGVRWRHPDVDDGQVGAELAHTPQQRIGVVDLGDDLDAVVAEQPRDPLTDQRRVVGDHDPHGSSARMVVPCPPGLSTASVALSASRRSRRPARPEPTVMRPPPQPSSATVTHRTPGSSASSTETRPAEECLTALVSASATTK